MHLVFFGDSICRGYGAKPGEGWVDLLAARLGTVFPDVTVSNAGVNGDITTEALQRMNRDVEALHPDLVYFQFGLNDCSWWCRQPGKPWVKPEQYAANLREIAERSLTCGAAAVLAGTNHLPACAGGAETEKTEFASLSHRRRTALYNEILRDTLAGTCGVTIADLERELPPGARIVLPDGLHLSTTGNVLYADMVGRSVNAVLREIRR